MLYISTSVGCCAPQTLVEIVIFSVFQLNQCFVANLKKPIFCKILHRISPFCVYLAFKHKKRWKWLTSQIEQSTSKTQANWIKCKLFNIKCKSGPICYFFGPNWSWITFWQILSVTCSKQMWGNCCHFWLALSGTK